MKKEKKASSDFNTEEKIKEAARKVFSSKGYAATRTRDIAQEAGINLALVNYYFRSKEKLFEEVMQEKVYQLFGTIVPILINPVLSFDVKIKTVAESYIDLLIENPDLPLLVLHELRNNADGFGTKLQLGPLLKQSSLISQIKERNPDVDPFQFILSMLGMMVFPFIARPLFTNLSGTSNEDFMKLMVDRKALIPDWMDAILGAR